MQDEFTSNVAPEQQFASSAGPPADAEGVLEFPEVLVEVERLQERKSSRLGGLAILVLSLLMFIVIGTGGKSGWLAGSQARQTLIILVAILFFHELGHYVAMRVFHYRNVRMFFIPLFGAAVSGTNYSAPGWKKVVVALMGPLPGIALGVVLGSVGIVLHHPLLIKIALISLLLNGSNLIPVLPLDGGRVVQSLLFSRHYAADAVFRALAAAALIWIGIKLPGRILLYLGIIMFLSIPLILRRGRIAAELRREGFGPRPSEDQKIPPEVADAIIARLKGGAAKKVKQNNKTLAQSTLAIYETLCNRPPGWLASIGFGLLHLSAFVLAAVMALALYAAQGGRFSNLIRSMANAPRQSISPRDVEVFGDQVPSGPRRTIVANLSTVSEARSAYASLLPTVSGKEAIERFGQTILLAFPASDDAARRRHVADIEKRTKTFAVSGNQLEGATFRLTCVAPDEATANQIRDQLDDYRSVPAGLHLIPPWSPAVSGPGVDWKSCTLARKTYHRLLQAGRVPIDDPARKELSTRMREAWRLGDAEETKRLAAEQAKLFAQRRQEDLNRLRAISDGSVDPVVVEDYLSIPTPTASDEEDQTPRLPDFSAAAYQSMARRMGQLPLVDGRPTAASSRFSTTFGSAIARGAILDLEYWSFEDPIEGAHSLVDWLYSRGCRSMRYEFQIPTEAGGLFN